MGRRLAAIGTFGWAAAKGVGLSRPVELRPRARWDVARAQQWHEETGWLSGCNFTPSTASNQLELWQPATFDPDTIARELTWAADVVGMNAIRLFLHDLCFTVEGPAFLDRVDRVLDLAAERGIRVLPVLFDGIWDPDPRPGPQRSPRPGVHNSTWVQGPGAAIIDDRTRWPTLRPYVEGVIERFAHDERVVGWDLFNEPDSWNLAWAHRDPSGKRAKVAALLEHVWDWAEAVDPTQPLTVGVYELVTRHPERASAVARTAIERSDVISFHCYSGAEGLTQAIDGLARHGRPLLCTEWMGRPASPVALAELLRDRKVGAFCWGLVDGRTQTRYPWTSWQRRTPPGAPWFHELLHPDGTPYDEDEAALLRRLSPR
jgi:hypothetical protein